MKRLLFLILLITSFSGVRSQGIETKLYFSDTTHFNFTSEWQYLSTDIFLLNGNQFNRVINDLYLPSDKKGKKRGLANEELEYLYITAQLMNVKYFGNNDVVYPLYNFQIDKSPENKYRTLVSDNIESIRIIDNLPLYTASDKIDAKIDVKALTYNDRDNILGFFGKQLQNLASVGRPTLPVLSLIGEMGNFIESNAKKREYRFSSTIRLFEQKNFDTRLHSIRVYAMVTPNTPKLSINFKGLENYLDTCNTNNDLDRKGLTSLMAYNTYPLIVVANYKSLYKMAEISGDEVNFANIDKRKVNIENNYRDKLISEETYKQEKDFISFLTLFANFKNQLELYTLNARTGNPDAASTALAGVVQTYSTLMQEYDVVNFKNKNSKVFNSTFKAEYASIVDFASFYLENDQTLRSTKLMCNTMINLNKKGIPQVPEEKENALRNLHAIDHFNKDFKERTKEGKNIMVLINQIEESLFSQVFATEIAKLDGSQASPGEKNEPLQRINEKIGSTNCQICRDRGSASVKNYYNKIEAKVKTDVLEKHRQLVAATQPEAIALSAKYDLLQQNIEKHLSDKNSLEYETYSKKAAEIHRDIQNLKNVLLANISDKSSQVIVDADDRILEITSSIKAGFDFIATNKPELLTEI